MDYRITDAHADEPGPSDSLCTEKQIRLSDSFLCYSPDDQAPPVGPLPAARGKPITFGCFNAAAKVNPPLLHLWAQILQQVPKSHLLLKNSALADLSTRGRILATFESFGITADRLVLIAFTPSRAAHLDLYNRVDIALDTFPYHGTTTTCEALWMGVPVVTYAGNAHVSRVGVSILSSLSHRDWIAGSAEAYIGTAVKLTSDISHLIEIRRTLRPRMLASPLMDAPRFAQNIEAAFRQMWQSWCANRLPVD